MSKGRASRMGDQHPACRLEVPHCGRRWSVGCNVRRKFLSERELNAERGAIAFVNVVSAQRRMQRVFGRGAAAAGSFHRVHYGITRSRTKFGYRFTGRIGAQFWRISVRLTICVQPANLGELLAPVSMTLPPRPAAAVHVRLHEELEWRRTIVLGAIAGDVIGSIYEFSGIKSKEFPLFTPESTFTDDSVLTVAVADWILGGRDLTDLMHEYHAAYGPRGYGGMFNDWASRRGRQPYNSFGNGAAMRVSAVGFAFETMDEVLEWAERSAAVTHNHPEGIRGAQAVAAAIYYARRERDRAWIRDTLEQQFGYDLGRTLEEIRPHYEFDVTCQGTVPEALIAFLESADYEDAIRNAISLGGDADTLACITGGVAEAYYGGLPPELAAEVLARLDPRLAAVVEKFRARFGLR